MVEQVWGVDRESLFASFGETFHGFRRGESTEIERVNSLFAGRGELREREAAESDPSFQQVIPYAAVFHEGQILEVRRRRSGGESRLHERRSIGIGGHIGPEDLSPPTASSAGASSTRQLESVTTSLTPVVAAGLARELAEELTLEPERDIERIRFLGFINDDTTDVGEVHFGLAFAVDVRSPVAVREVDKLDGSWTSLDGVQDDESLETWSRFLVGALRPDA